jgi:RNA polymerase sigma-70 factor (ECF subfamily)
MHTSSRALGTVQGKGAFDGWVFAGVPWKVTVRHTDSGKQANCNENVTFLRMAANTSMDSDRNLDSLMARYQAGDFVAVTALVERIGPQLHRFFMAQSASRSDADDLLQETWLRIHRVRHTYRPGEPVAPWFYAIARRVRIDQHRRASRTTARERPLDEVYDATAVPERDEAQVEELETLLAPLSESQREVIRMMKVAGMSLEEVARATSCSVGSVKQKVHRAYKILRDRINAMGPQESSEGLQ